MLVKEREREGTKKILWVVEKMAPKKMIVLNELGEIFLGSCIILFFLNS